MRPTDYTSAEKFPLTTQKGLSPSDQLMIDAHNLDALREYAEDHALKADEQELLAELEAKAKVAPAVRAALTAEGQPVGR